MPRIRKYIDIRYNAWNDLIPDYKKIIDKVIRLTYKHSYISKIADDRLLSKPIYNEEFLGEAKMSTAAYEDVHEERKQVSTTKLSLEIEFGKKSNIGHKTLEMYIFLDDDKSLHEKNLIYRGKDKPTNVISVPMFKTCYKEPELLENIMLNQLGDIYISVDTLIKEVESGDYTDYEFFTDRSNDMMLYYHFAHMICHGFLHLLGYDHVDDKDAEIMEEIEKNIIYRLTIAAN